PSYHASCSIDELSPTTAARLGACSLAPYWEPRGVPGIHPAGDARHAEAERLQQARGDGAALAAGTDHVDWPRAIQCLHLCADRLEGDVAGIGDMPLTPLARLAHVHDLQPGVRLQLLMQSLHVHFRQRRQRPSGRLPALHTTLEIAGDGAKARDGQRT